jgi:hypothetical protein
MVVGSVGYLINFGISIYILIERKNLKIKYYSIQMECKAQEDALRWCLAFNTAVRPTRC